MAHQKPSKAEIARKNGMLGGRPPGYKVLDNLLYQQIMIRRIVITGEEKNCWEGIVSKPTYERWKKKNEDAWTPRIQKAISQHHNHMFLADPGLRRVIIKQLVERIHSGELTTSELLKVLKHLPEIPEVKLDEQGE